MSTKLYKLKVLNIEDVVYVHVGTYEECVAKMDEFNFSMDVLKMCLNTKAFTFVLSEVI